MNVTPDDAAHPEEPPGAGTAAEPRTPEFRPAERRDTSTSSGLDDLVDIGRLADRLGVEHSTIRVWLSRKVPWLPAPDGRLNGGAVWRATTLAGIEDRRAPGRPGRKRLQAAPINSLAEVPEQAHAPAGANGALEGT